MRNIHCIITFVDQVQLGIQVEMKQQYIFHTNFSIVQIAVRLFRAMI